LGEPIRTVIVDDEEEVRSLLRIRLERDGGFVVVGEGSNGAEAAEVCAATQPHLIILDAAMPDGDGIEAVPHIRRSTPHSIVVIYTSATGIATRNDAERVGAHAVVGKLDSFDLLLGTIYRFLPEFAPVDETKADRTEFSQRMSALLEDDAAASGRRGWSTWAGKTRVWFILFLIVVVLPLLAFGVWAVAQLLGHGLSIG
jgi:DNA-binding NarL/FixJ family response regulator